VQVVYWLSWVVPYHSFTLLVFGLDHPSSHGDEIDFNYRIIPSITVFLVSLTIGIGLFWIGRQIRAK
jgi:hypothetical protein